MLHSRTCKIVVVVVIVVGAKFSPQLYSPRENGLTENRRNSQTKKEAKIEKRQAVT